MSDLLTTLHSTLGVPREPDEKKVLADLHKELSALIKDVLPKFEVLPHYDPQYYKKLSPYTLAFDWLDAPSKKSAWHPIANGIDYTIFESNFSAGHGFKLSYELLYRHGSLSDLTAKFTAGKEHHTYTWVLSQPVAHSLLHAF